ncbi:MAG TPA: ribonucleotide reductase N-terminal alpha domain-containing protein, partial [Nitrolancea sp.]|nr:ribonucleotide reductase N-terminal alpha domain-containing protein [Nitrolancea sp.]
MKRDGRTVEFDRTRINHAIEMAFRAEIGCPFPDPLKASVADQVESITGSVIDSLPGHSAAAKAVNVETIQDEVEHRLMAAGEFAVARRYILYREARARRREEQSLRVRDANGQEILLNRSLLRSWIDVLCDGPQRRTFAKVIYDEVLSSVPSGAPLQDFHRAIIFAARSRIEQDPAYSFVAARALLGSLYAEVLGHRVTPGEANGWYPGAFSAFIREAVDRELLDPELKAFDLDRLGHAINAGRDHQFQYLGLQTLYDRYLIHHRQRRIELPQMFWMRVAMGLALREQDREARAIEFYNLISTFRFCPSTPTLFNAG